MKLIFYMCIFLIYSLPASAADKIIFSGGAPLDSHQPSIIVPLLKEAFYRNNIEFDARHYPSKRSLKMSNSGQTDGELHRIYGFHKASNNQYPNLIRIESKLMSVNFAIFSIGDFGIESIEDFDGLRIAYRAGKKNITKILQNSLQNNEIVETDTEHQALLMLVKDRVDIVIAESFQVKMLIAQEPKFEKIIEIFSGDEIPIYSYINIKHQALADKIALTLEAMKNDGSFVEITSIAEQKLILNF